MKRNATGKNVRRIVDRIVCGTLSVEKIWRNQPGDSSATSDSVLYWLERDETLDVQSRYFRANSLNVTSQSIVQARGSSDYGRIITKWESGWLKKTSTL